MSARIYTKISQAFWRNPDGEFVSANIDNLKIWKDGPNEVYWFDKLFEGGIFLPKKLDGKKRALTILLTGPPGTGKSTIALELCHRWADTTVIEKNIDGLPRKKKKHFKSLFITSESEEEWVIQKAKSLWNDVESNFVDGADGNQEKSRVHIWQTSEISSFLQDQKIKADEKVAILNNLAVIWRSSNYIKHDEVAKSFKTLWAKRLIQKGLKNFKPQILVIDSLNTVEESSRAELYKRFMYLVDAGPEIIITVLESDIRKRQSSFWEYSSDIVIRLDKEENANYLIRNIEIEKARYQSHVWGKHQLKIYSKNIKTADSEKNPQNHPYRNEGGIFIYPSIHYYLSIYKHLKPQIAKNTFRPPITGLDQILKDGFPRGRCTGFIGMRGGHKSHLGYLSVLSRIISTGSNEKALVVSLRDDEDMAEKTLNKILKNELQCEHDLSFLKAQDKIEILYFPPGYVTPEEFFHRVFMSVQRLKSHQGDPDVIVLFNSLDQLSSRFPLCAKQQIFIPGLIATLRSENVTSFFIAVEEPGQPPEQYGLLSMADALITFTREKIDKEQYLGHLNDSLKIKNTPEYDDIVKNISKTQHVVALRIVRFSGGRAAGAGGLIELIHSDEPKAHLYRDRLKSKNGLLNTGLVFIPFSPSFDEGECVVKDWSIK